MEFKRDYLNKNKKQNYKKKIKNEGECCICFQNCILYSDNVIKCGKKVNVCCSNCKHEMIKSKNFNCPLCRSHPIKQPISKDVYIKLNIKDKKKSKYPILSPKLERGKRRKHLYEETFGPNTNRIVRQRRRMYDSNSINPMLVTHFDIWLSDERVAEYNGMFNYDTDSDTVSTLSIETEIDINEF